jgi:DNA anti-recombination protein RmuC
LKEAAYIAVGLGVLGFQRAQVQRVELTKQLEEQLNSLPSAWTAPVEGYAAFVKEQTATTRARVTEQLSDLSRALEDALAPVREQIKLPDLGEQVEAQWTSLRAQVAELAKTVDQRFAPARAQLDEQIDQLEERLPAGARSFVHSVREAASNQEHALRNVVGLH